ncbi:preprotein translocase subunit SecA [Candidatus Kinetoplastibacterium desouzaii TCC079E]|uniref:Protein translocase subunit SecA n=1 Tax=Candidatus Kinetoplastidibacterium desouzai TCC079E TaxID=1208919 RepID=M1M4H9_9PROT|nr:preprotein translocase subunit SecA [Candidatus Kinetoplastibacterium desouzaii]AGF47115.1 preprotein translocase subunit SecA [Candidatus Kinetoplastibacterium desouzaii TCC079E]
MDVFFLFKKFFGTRNDRILKKYYHLVNRINDLEAKFKGFTNEEIKAKTKEFREKYDKGISLDDLLPEAFAVVREASRRVYNMRHFDVQLLGGIALHNGKIAEMRTGEGKTLTATLAVYLNAIAGKGVHVVTVNDYLARRDAEWMGKLYNFLDLSIGVVVSDQSSEEKINAYNSDITYGTNNEFGFDYLRDNMEFNLHDKRQRLLSYAIVDEVDSILIDEARTPLIISGPSEEHNDLYERINLIVNLLKRMRSEPDREGNEPEGDFWIDEKNQQIYLSESGHENIERILKNKGLLNSIESLYDSNNIHLINYVMASLRAWNLFHKDHHYVVRDNEIVIVDEFTGRLMSGRRWSDGLHQAIEAKEGVLIKGENHTMASITFQNYFRMYEKLAGMTGTAATEAYEFQEIYGLETVVIPTNKPLVRKDYNDHIYRTNQEKYDSIIKDIISCHDKGQPVLIGTTSIENSEILSEMLRKHNLSHNILNAKQHEREADIIAEAGKPFCITIATNMAGRGTDILLGGNLDKQIEKLDINLDNKSKKIIIDKLKYDWKNLNKKVKDSGGLHIIGTERHESRRIDNQLRGRAGRQGDPGSSCFYLSLEDSLMRIFAGDKLKTVMDHLKLPHGEPIKAGIVDRAIENAQRKVESRNFDIRKQLLEYDDVSNEQRRIIYSQRNEILSKLSFTDLIESVFKEVIYSFKPLIETDSFSEQENLLNIQNILKNEIYINLNLVSLYKENINLIEDIDQLLDVIVNTLLELYNLKIDKQESLDCFVIERMIFLQAIDYHWRDHISFLDILRQGIHLRGYAQKNPKQEYRKEAFEHFAIMLLNIRKDVMKNLLFIDFNNYNKLLDRADNNNVPVGKIKRNEPCYCGSGRKFKHCHGSVK